MATIEDLDTRSLSELSTEELFERVRMLRTRRRELSNVKKSRLSAKPAKKKAPSTEEITDDMSIEAIERLIKQLEAHLK